MSATGPISNYYVDSLISHDNEDLLASRFPATGAHPAAARPSGLVPDCSDFPSCSFAPKPAVFSTSWAPVPSQSSVVYHPYGPQPHLGADTRYMRTWLEPLSGAVSFPSFPAGGRHYALTCQVPLSMGILQAGILEWVVLPFPRGSSRPGIEPGSPALQVDSLPAELAGKPQAQKTRK